MDEGIALLRLARTAHTLFENYSGLEKRRLLNFVLSNCTWKHGELHAEIANPLVSLRKRSLKPTHLKGAAVPEPPNLKIGRGDRIRTCDPLLPKQMRYQAALLPDPVRPGLDL